MMDTRQLATFKSHLKNLIAEGNFHKSIEELRPVIPKDSVKYNLLIHLSSQYNHLKDAEIKNTLPFGDLSIRQAALTDNLLGFIDGLEEADFAPAATESSDRKSRMGSVLYAIPGTMEKQRETECVVRLAFDERSLLDSFSSNSHTHIRALRRIDKRMEVELLDPNEENAFAIRTVSSREQIVEKEDYTEWIYYVKPLKEGKFPLFLKVSIIIIEDHDKVRKELILQEVIEVVAHATPAPETGVSAPMMHSGFIFSFGLPAVPLDADPDSNTDANPDLPDPGAGQVSIPGSGGGTMTGTAAKGVFQTLVSNLPQIAISTTVVTAVGLGYYAMTSTPDAPVVDATSKVQTRFAGLSITPPIAQVNIEPKQYYVVPDRDTLLLLEGGTAIKIPASIFMDKNNQLVDVPVEIRFREFHNPAEIIVSGIPMKVFNAEGREDWMKTEGMYEIGGFTKNGDPVSILPGKFITVEMPNPSKGKCDFWHFNRESGNWDKLGSAEGQTNPRKDSVAPENGKTPLPRPPLKPSLVNPDKPVLKFNINYNALPELRGVGGILWQYAGNDPKKDPSNNLHPSDWDHIKVERGQEPDICLMTLTRGAEKLVLPVRPCRNQGAYGKAMADYEQKVKAYESQREKIQEKIRYREAQNEFVRGYPIGQFGVYNWDYLLSRNESLSLSADFDFGGQLPAEMKKQVIVYLVTAGGATVIDFPHASWAGFSYLPSMGSRLVALMPDGRVSVFSQADFEREKTAIKQSQGQRYVFKMKVLPQKIHNLSDLRKVVS